MSTTHSAAPFLPLVDEQPSFDRALNLDDASAGGLAVHDHSLGGKVNATTAAA